VATDWVRRINAAYAGMGLSPEVYHVEGLLTTTREALAHPREIVDTYVRLGFRALFLRPTDPFGFAQERRGQLGFGPAEYLDFYRQAVDYMIELNRSGTQILERYAAIFLMKILKGEEPNYLDIRSPCGAAIGQMAYGADGKVFTCDEARMLDRMGDPFFQIGEVGSTSYGQVLGHPLVRALVLASNLDGSPDCSTCAYNPYCGICPVFNYATQGSLHGQQRTSAWCATHMGVQDHLFGKLLDGDPAVVEILDRWATVRPRDHFLHEGGAAD
jgi:radical SAM protein with 4Fe4S-binding SPASM domain